MVKEIVRQHPQGAAATVCAFQRITASAWLRSASFAPLPADEG